MGGCPLTWNWFDAAVFLISIITIISGYRQGLIRIVAGWLGLVAGLVAAVLFYRPVKSLLLGALHIVPALAGQNGDGSVYQLILPAFIAVLSFALVVVGVSLAVRIVGNLIHRLFDVAGIGWLDGALGALVCLGLFAFGLALVMGMMMPLLEMAEGLHWAWAVDLKREITGSYTGPWLKTMYLTWGRWFSGGM